MCLLVFPLQNVKQLQQGQGEQRKLEHALAQVCPSHFCNILSRNEWPPAPLCCCPAVYPQLSRAAHAVQALVVRAPLHQPMSAGCMAAGGCVPSHVVLLMLTLPVWSLRGLPCVQVKRDAALLAAQLEEAREESAAALAQASAAVARNSLLERAWSAALQVCCMPALRGVGGRPAVYS